VAIGSTSRCGPLLLYISLVSACGPNLSLISNGQGFSTAGGLKCTAAGFSSGVDEVRHTHLGLLQCGRQGLSGASMICACGL
jgi:hypothetical protein